MSKGFTLLFLIEGTTYILWEREVATYHLMWDTKCHIAFMRDWRNLIEFYEKWREPRCILERQNEPHSIQWVIDSILWKKTTFNQIVATAALLFSIITNKMQLYTFYFCEIICMFQAVPPPIIRRSKLYIHHRVIFQTFTSTCHCRGR